MQLSTLDGIACDNCGETHKREFIYFSYDIKSAAIINNKRPPLDHILNFETQRSFDICGGCHHKNTEAIIKNQSTKLSLCELSGAPITGILYYCVVAKVSVNLCNGNVINVNNRDLEFSICGDTYQQMINSANALKAAYEQL